MRLRAPERRLMWEDGRWVPRKGDLVNETKWIVWTMPGGDVDQRLKERAILLTLSVPSDDTSVIEAVEAAAARAGMTITRMEDDLLDV